MSAARFEIGQQVRISNRTPPVHHRVPGYAKGQTGVVERVCGLHGEPEKFVRGDGEPMRRIYRVSISQNELWKGYEGNEEDKLEIEIFEHWLELVE